jgi:hypothetical protein
VLLLFAGAGALGLLAGQLIGLRPGCCAATCCCTRRARDLALRLDPRRAPTCTGTRNSGASRCRRTCSTPWSASCRCS